MAVAKGQQYADAAPRKLYMGIGAVKVLAVNPTKAELEKIYGRDIENEPTYLSETEIEENGVKKKFPSVRITFICQTDPDKNNGIDTIIQHTLFLRKQYRKGSNSGKYQVIDVYGRTAWGTQDEVKAKQIPQYTNGPANIDADYRPAIVGEEYLTMFIKNLLNIPNVQSFVNGTWIDNPKVAKEDCLVRLDEIDNYFKGDFKELREIISYQPDNLVKIAFGIRHTDDGRTHQTTYDRMCFKNAVTEFGKLDEEIQNRRSQGGLQDSEYDYTELHEYVVTPTNTAALAGSDNNAAEEATAEDPWA